MFERKGLIGGIVFGVIIIIALIVTCICTVIVPAGYVAVQYKMNGGIAEETLSQGWHIVSPTVKSSLYTVGIEQSYLTASEDGDSPNDDSFSAPSSDGKGLQMELTFTYRFNEEKVSEIFTKFKGRSGSELLDTFIKPNIISWTKEVTAKYPVADILGEKRAELNTVLTNYLAEKFNSYNIIIESASLINIEVDDETRAAVTKKVTAQQELELAKIEEQTAKVQAEKDKEVAIINAQKDKETASIQAEQAKIKAEGEAQALSIKSNAEAEANARLQQSLSNEILKKSYIEKWNGQLPTYAAGDQSSVIMDINK